MAGAGYLLFTAGQVLTAAQVNTYLNEQAVMVFATTAARDSALTSVKSEGMVTYQLDNNDLDIYNGSTFSTLIAPAHGALTSWTPTVTQSGSVTVTNTRSVYQRIGRMIAGSFNLSVTGSGTGSNAIIVGALPATAAAASVSAGVGEILDTSAASKVGGRVFIASTTTFDFRYFSSVAVDNRLGIVGMTAALASGDTLEGCFRYDAAADA